MQCRLYLMYGVVDSEPSPTGDVFSVATISPPSMDLPHTRTAGQRRGHPARCSTRFLMSACQQQRCARHARIDSGSVESESRSPLCARRSAGTSALGRTRVQSIRARQPTPPRRSVSQSWPRTEFGPILGTVVDGARASPDSHKGKDLGHGSPNGSAGLSSALA